MILDPADHDHTIENHVLDRKFLRFVTGKPADFNDLAKDCVCFSNGVGGQPLIGIEDDATAAFRSSATMCCASRTIAR